MSCNCNKPCNCVDSCSDTQIRRIVDDAVADRIEDMEDIASSAQGSATASENSADQSAQSATQSQQFATIAGNNATSAAQSAQQAAASATAAAGSATAAVQVTTGLKQVADELTDTASRLSDKVDGANQAAEDAVQAKTEAQASALTASQAASTATTASTSASDSANLAQASATNAQGFANTAQQAAVETVGAAAGVKDKLDDWAIQYPSAVQQMNDAVASTSADATTATNAATNASASETSATASSNTAQQAANQAKGYVTAVQSGVVSYASTALLLAAAPTSDQLGLAMDTDKLYHYIVASHSWNDLNVTFSDYMENISNLNKALNSTETTWEDISGTSRPTWQGIEDKNDELIEATRQNLIPLSKQYVTLAEAQADIANIPVGSYTYIRSSNDKYLADEYQNVSGTLTATGKHMPSAMVTGYQAASAASSSAENTIDITIPGLLAEGSLIYFSSPILNTGAVTLNVTDVKGNTVNRIVLRGANAPLAGGELIASHPVLCVYRDAPIYNFRLVASGPMASEVAASLAAYKTTNDALTSTLRNQVPIPVAVNSVADDIYTATSAIVGGELQGGRLFLFTPPSANTTRTPKLKLNAWGSYDIRHINGGQLAVGDLLGGRAHLLHWHSGSNQFRVMTYTDERDRIFGSVLRATMTSDASTPNDLSVTVDGVLNNGTLLVLEPPATNTGAVAITVVNRYGDQIVRSVFKGANSPLSGGEIKYAQPVLLMYRGAPQNNFKIITSGDLSTPVAKLQTDVETLKTSFTDPYAKLAKKLIGDGTTANTGPFGSISFTNGVRTTVKRRLVFTSIGSSVGVGAGSSDGSKFAPNALFVEAMKAQLDGYGNFEFINDNQCIPTQALQQFSAQLQNSPYFTSTNENDWPDFVLIVGGMNDAPVGNFNNGLTFPSQKTRLESLIDECKAKGAVVIVATSPHHNPLSPSVTAMDLGSLNVSWPVRTFNVDTNYTFDAAARTINGGAFSYPGWGGQILRVGHTLSVLSGDNAGAYTIEAISEDRNTITVAESFPASGLIKTTIRHIGLNSLKEEILEPPPSKSFVERNWSGSGVKTVGAARFAMVNSMFRSVARDKAVFLMECEIPWFRDGVEVHGWNALFDGTNYNHPNDLGYTVSYKAGADKAAFDLCNLIYGEKYYLPS